MLYQSNFDEVSPYIFCHEHVLVGSFLGDGFHPFVEYTQARCVVFCLFNYIDNIYSSFSWSASSDIMVGDVIPASWCLVPCEDISIPKALQFVCICFFIQSPCLAAIQCYWYYEAISADEVLSSGWCLHCAPYDVEIASCNQVPLRSAASYVCGATVLLCDFGAKILEVGNLL